MLTKRVNTLINPIPEGNDGNNPYAVVAEPGTALKVIVDAINATYPNSTCKIEFKKGIGALKFVATKSELDEILKEK